MIQRFTVFAALLCSTIGFASAAETLTLDKEKSKIEFVGSKADGKHDGGFKKFEAKATADLETPANSALEVVIDTRSLWSDNQKLTNHLKNPDFFDVRKYPKATFKSTEVIPGNDEGRATIVGKLTMLDKAVEIKVPAIVEVTDSTITVKTTDFKIDRSQWGMTYGEGQINNDVAVNAVLVFKR